jgi:hypothetical protein
MNITQDFPIKLKSGTLPAGAVYNAQTYFDAIVARMTATVSADNVIWGQLGGTEPPGELDGVNDQAGLWFGNPDTDGMGYWNDWNTDAKKYLPIPLVCGQYTGGNLRTTEFVCGAVTADTTITTPDGSGTLALQSDLIQALGIQTFSNMPATMNIDWSNRAPVYILMNGNLTINATNDKDGLVMDFYLENPTGAVQATTWTVTMPGVVWPIVTTGTQDPALSQGALTFRVIDHIRVYRAGGVKFGQVVARNYRIALGSDHIIPTPTGATGTGNRIDVEFNGPLAGGSYPTADLGDFTVLVTGTADNVTSAIYSGNTLTVNLTKAMKNTDTVTIAYAGSDLKALNGNTIAHWAALNVDLTENGGIHNARTGPTGQPTSPP